MKRKLAGSLNSHGTYADAEAFRYRKAVKIYDLESYNELNMRWAKHNNRHMRYAPYYCHYSTGYYNTYREWNARRKRRTPVFSMFDWKVRQND